MGYEGGAKSLVIRMPDDFHVHLRDGLMLQAVAKYTAKHFRRALVMPNLDKPVLDVFNALAYWNRIQTALFAGPPGQFRPMMTIKLTDETTPNVIHGIYGSGHGGPNGQVIAAKLYPTGVTTNSHDGVSNVKKLFPVFEAMQEHGMVLCLHAETPGVFCLDREWDFTQQWLWDLTVQFPKLKIVVEHVSQGRVAQFIAGLSDTVAATITVHHLLLTLDSVVGDRLKPHHFCKPIAKRPEDRAILRDYVTSGNKSFFLGTDSAPHPRSKKECDDGCAGVFTAPVALALLAEIFESNDKLENLEKFTSLNGAAFYGLEPNTETVTLVKESWEVPDAYELPGLSDVSGKPDKLIPLCAGKTLPWRAWPDPKNEP